MNFSSAPELTFPPRHIPLLLKLRLLFASGLACIGWIVAGSLMVGVLGFATNTDFSFIRFRGTLVTTAGVVLESREIEKSPYNNHWVRYSFITEKEEREGECYSSHYSPGQKVNIEYRESDPGTSRIQGVRGGFFPPDALFPIFFAIAGFSLVIAGMIRGFRQISVLQRGILTTGVLQHTEKTSASINKQNIYRMVFSYEDSMGNNFERAYNSHENVLFGYGTEVPVLYDPEYPASSMIWEECASVINVCDGQIKANSVALLALYLPALLLVALGIYLRFSDILPHLEKNLLPPKSPYQNESEQERMEREVQILLEVLDENRKHRRLVKTRLKKIIGAKAPSLILPLLNKDHETKIKALRLVEMLDVDREVIVALFKTMESGRWELQDKAGTILKQMDKREIAPHYSIFVEKMASPNSAVQFVAFQLFQKTDIAAQEKIPVLLQNLNHSNYKIKKQARESLDPLRMELIPFIPQLTQMLVKQDHNSRLAAIELLEKIGAKAIAAAPQLVVLLTEGGPIGKKAGDILVQIGGDTVPLLAQVLKQKGMQKRKKAVQILGAIGEPAISVVPDLILALDDHSQVRQAAIEVLLKMGPMALPPLYKALKSENWQIKKSVVQILGQTEKNALSASRLLEVLTEKDDELKIEAIKALGNMGPQAASAVTVLMAEIKKEKEEIARESILTLGKIGLAATEAIPLIIDQMATRTTSIRDGAVTALVTIGPPAIPALRDALKNKYQDNYYFTPSIITVIGNMAMESDIAIVGLIDGLHHKRYQVRQKAAKYLAKLGPRAKPVIPIIIQALKNDDNQVKETLLTLGAHALPDLIETLKDKDSEIRMKAVEIIGKMAPTSANAVPALLPLLEDEELRVRENTLKTLGKMEEKAAQAVPLLIFILQKDNRQMKREAARTLGQIGPKANKALPALKKAMRDKDRYVRTAARMAIDQIRDD